MLKHVYIVTKHSYWEHYGAKPVTSEYETKEEAEKAVNDYETRWFMEDGYYATMRREKRVVITLEEELLREKRKAMKQQKPFDYKKDSYCYGIYTFWDGTKDRFYIICEEDCSKSIVFLKDNVKYTLATKYDYFLRKLNGKWMVGSNESMHILGGLGWLPRDMQKIDTVAVDYKDNILDLFD